MTKCPERRRTDKPKRTLWPTRKALLGEGRVPPLPGQRTHQRVRVCVSSAVRQSEFSHHEGPEGRLPRTPPEAGGDRGSRSQVRPGEVAGPRPPTWPAPAPRGPSSRTVATHPASNHCETGTAGNAVRTPCTGPSSLAALGVIPGRPLPEPPRGSSRNGRPPARPVAV